MPLWRAPDRWISGGGRYEPTPEVGDLVSSRCHYGKGFDTGPPQVCPGASHSGTLPRGIENRELALELVCGADFWCNRHCETSPVDLEGFWGQVWPKIGRKTTPENSGQTAFRYPSSVTICGANKALIRALRGANKALLGANRALIGA